MISLFFRNNFFLKKKKIKYMLTVENLENTEKFKEQQNP